MRTGDLCDAGAMLYQLSYETSQLGAGHFVGFMCCSVIELMHI